MKKTYQNRKIGHASTQTKQTPAGWKIMRAFLVFFCIGSVLWIAIQVTNALKPTFSVVKKKTTEIISQQIGIPPTYDSFGSINILLMGYGGRNHPGGFLTDSMMVASINPIKGTTTLISIPRDLYIKRKGYSGKINGSFPTAMAATGHHKKDLNESLDWSAKENISVVEDITGLTIPYYALISFDGFKDFINDMDGVYVDVPERLVDRSFPDARMVGYDPLVVEPGLQLMDGTLALKYARSRKSTSDFSRAYRQQQIIKGIVAQFKNTISITNLGKIESLYASYTNMVSTNITLKNILNLAQYKDSLTTYSSYVLTSECGNHYTTMNTGCFLAATPRKRFGGASALAPMGYTYSNLSNYNKIHDFVYLVTKFPHIKKEQGSIKIYNAIDPQVARTKYSSRSGKANKIATTLKQYGLTIDAVDNADEYRPRTIAYVQDAKKYTDTINALRLFMDVDIYTGNTLSGGSLSGQVSETPIKLYVGNNFLDSYTTNRFWK